jgi:hypothetical protein
MLSKTKIAIAAVLPRPPRAAALCLDSQEQLFSDCIRFKSAPTPVRLHKIQFADLHSDHSSSANRPLIIQLVIKLTPAAYVFV